MQTDRTEGLRVRDIRKQYRRQGCVWSGVSFTLEPGEVLGIRGANGAGKSTLLRILATLERPEQGDIRYQGEDIFCRSGKRHYRSILGYVPQEIALYPELTGYENLRFFGRANHMAGERLEHRIRQVCADIRIEEEILSRRCGLCSGGMKRRLNLAAALLHEPQLLLLDEPAVGIDTGSREAIWKVLCEERERGTAMLYVTHEEQELAAVCTRYARLEEGRWLEDGTIDKC